MLGIRDEYAPKFGRQILTVWEGSFCSEYVGRAAELPKSDGFMVYLEGGPGIRVTCPAPRTDANYLAVDEAISVAIISARQQKALERP